MNIRGKKNRLPKKAKIEDVKVIHDCLDCEGCLCEDFCKEYEEQYFSESGDSLEG